MHISPSRPSTARAAAIVLTSLLASHVALGQSTTKQRDAAIADVEAAVAESPRDATLFLRLGNLWLEADEVAGARDAFARAIDLAPQMAKAHERLGCVRSRQGAYADALGHFTKALSLAPDDYETWESRAQSKREAGFLLGAIEDFTEAIRLAPERATLRRERGKVHFDAGRHDEAVSDLRAACELDSAAADDTALYLWLARAARGDRGSASAELALNIDEHASAGETWYTVVGAFLLGTLDEIELLHVASRTESDAARRERRCEAHFYAGFVKLLDGSADEAADSFRRCVDAGTYDSTAHASAVAALSRLDGESVADASAASDQD